MQVVSRFAPSPSGYLHLGHALAALFAERAARAVGGRFLLRIEDIDAARCRAEYDAALQEDLRWLGVAWDEPVLRQSTRLEAYEHALAALRERALVYPCFCTRADIRAEVARSPSAPHGPDGALYPGTCRTLTEAERTERIQSGAPFAWRIDVARAVASIGHPLYWRDAAAGEMRSAPETLGDVVLARKEVGTSYHLAVTVDDAFQGVTLVTRGTDLFHATHMHRLLQELLGLPVPRYHHHGLVTDEEGIRLSTRDGATALRTLRQKGWTPQYVRRRIGLAEGAA